MKKCWVKRRVRSKRVRKLEASEVLKFWGGGRKSSPLSSLLQLRQEGRNTSHLILCSLSLFIWILRLNWSSFSCYSLFLLLCSNAVVARDGMEEGRNKNRRRGKRDDDETKRADRQMQLREVELPQVIEHDAARCPPWNVQVELLLFSRPLCPYIYGSLSALSSSISDHHLIHGENDAQLNGHNESYI